MESLYIPIKHTHVFLITLSIILFNIKFWLKFMQPQKPLHLLWRIVPHINDSILLFTGMMMMVIAKWAPFGASKWLGVKLCLVVTYMVCGIFAIRSPGRTTKAWIAYGAAMFVVACVVYLARFKPI